MYVCMYACISAGCIAVTLTAEAKYIDGRSSKRSKGASQLAYIVQLLLLVSNCCGINSFITRLEVTHCTFGKSRQNCRWLATVTCPLSTIRHFLTSVNCVLVAVHCTACVFPFLLLLNTFFIQVVSLGNE